MGPRGGYPTIGARNITACVGNYHCICGNCNTFELARKIEPIIFPSHYHIKINIAGCPNDCNKAHLCDFGIIGGGAHDLPPRALHRVRACVRACRCHPGALAQRGHRQDRKGPLLLRGLRRVRARLPGQRLDQTGDQVFTG